MKNMRNVGALLLFAGCLPGVYLLVVLLSGGITGQSDIYTTTCLIVTLFVLAWTGHWLLTQYTNSQKDFDSLSQKLLSYGFRQFETVPVTIYGQFGYFEDYGFELHSQKITISQSTRDEEFEKANPLRFTCYFDHQKHLVLVKDDFLNCAYVFFK